MKHPLFASAVVLALFGAGLSASPLRPDFQDPVDLGSRVLQLSTSLEAINARLARLEQEQTALLTALTSVSESLVIQGQQAEAMLLTLNQAEELGFTAGINFQSREVLLLGWRNQLTAIKDAASKLGGNPPVDKAKTDETPPVK